MEREKIVNAMCAASGEVFSTMLGLEVTPAESFQENSTPVANEGVLALIGLAGSWVGTGMLICSAELACRISSLMLMTEYKAVDGDVLTGTVRPGSATRHRPKERVRVESRAGAAPYLHGVTEPVRC